MSVRRIALKERPRVLCIDDEPDVLEGVGHHLRRGFKVDVTTDPFEALKKMQRETYAVVMSDMRMPAMSGAVLLARAAEASPDSVRVLLTGQSDLQDAVAAVNEGGIFRFLMKPCPPPQLQAAIGEAARQHALIVSERQLLEETLRGSVQVLSEMLALVSPTVFGRSNRQKRLVAGLARAVGLKERWQVEVAAMLGQLGLVTCGPGLVDKVYHGAELSPKEQEALGEADKVTARLLMGIPRLDEVLALVEAARAVEEAEPPLAAMVLRVVADYDALEARLGSPGVAISAMEEQPGAYNTEVFEAFKAMLAKSAPLESVRQVAVHDLRAGMVLAADVKTKAGAVFAARGYEITERFLARARNFPEALAEPTIAVVVKAPPLSESA